MAGRNGKTADLEIQRLKLADLKEHPGNPRKHPDPGSAEWEVLKTSLLHDYYDPLIYNVRNGMLVSGHLRRKVLLSEGFTQADVVVKDYDEATHMARMISANKAIGEYDWPLLKDGLELIDDGAFDMGLTGFLDSEIEDLMTQFHVPGEGNIEDDEVPEVGDPICKTGDLWKLGEHRLLCGDATKEEDVGRLMGGEKADMVFTDPPYGINYQDVKHKHRKIEGDEGVNHISELLVTTLVLGVPLFICCSWQSLAILEAAMVSVDKKPKACIVWDKEVRTQNLDKFAKQHEFILYHGPFGGEKTVDVDIWQCARQISSDHPTAKPVGIIVRAVKHFPKGIVVDLFGGSGSTLIACEKLNRKCRMMEIDEHYCDVIVKRWENFTGQKAELIDA